MFIYDAVLHAYLYGNTEVDVAQIRDYVTALDEKKDGQEQTQLDTEFQVHESIRNRNSLCHDWPSG